MTFGQKASKCHHLHANFQRTQTDARQILLVQHEHKVKTTDTNTHNQDGEILIQPSSEWQAVGWMIRGYMVPIFAVASFLVLALMKHFHSELF